MGRRAQTSSLTDKKATLQVAGYIRLSNDDGNDVSYSVINQKSILNDYCEKVLDVPYHLEFYIDDGISGTTSNRYDFQRMLQDVNNHTVNTIIVKDLSRLSRNTYECLKYIQNDFVIANIRFISITQPYIDSFLHPETLNSLMVPIQSTFNEYHAQSTSEKILQVFQQKKEKGQFIGAFAPYGYKKDPLDKNHLIIDEEIAEVIRDIFYWRAYDGFSCIGIAEKLNELGVLSPSEYKRSKRINFSGNSTDTKKTLWWEKTIRELLKNRVYLGDMVQSKSRVMSYKIHKMVRNSEDKWIIVENTHDAIVSKQVFELVQKTMQLDTHTDKKKTQLSLFSGILKCVDCHKAMNKSKAGNITYYICSTNKRQSKKACSRHSIRLDVLEKGILEAIKNQIDLSINLSQVIEEIEKAPIIRSQSSRLEKQLLQKEQVLKKTMKIKDGLYLDYKEELITKDDYLRFKSKYETEIKEIDRSIEVIKKEQDIFKDGIAKENPYLKGFLKYKNIETLNRTLLLELIEDIYVHEDRTITIKFNYQDQYLLILDWIRANAEVSKETEILSTLSYWNQYNIDII